MLRQFGITRSGVGGLGEMSPAEFIALQHMMSRQDLRKATSTAGYHSPDTSPGTGAALVPQSLEGTLASATYKKEDAVFWRMVAKKQVYATVNEYSRIEKHGEAELDMFFSEGGVPHATVTQYVREFSRVVYFGVQGSVTFPMMRSRIIGGQANAEAQEVYEKTMHLIGQIEYASYFADSRVNDKAFDGLRTILERFAPNNIVDMRGGVLTGKQMRNDMALHRDLYAKPTDVFMSHGVRADLGNMGESSIRRPITGSNNPAQRLGMRAEGLVADHGFVPFHSTTFLQPGGAPNAAAIQPDPQTAAPNTPVQAGNPAKSQDAASLFTDDDAGTYFYKVVAVGPGGVSAPLTSTGIGVVKGDKVTWDINPHSSHEYYRFYRSDKDGLATTCKYFTQLKKAGAGDTQLVDLNADIPGTTWTFSIQMTDDVIEFIRLLDMMKQDLAIRSTTKEFLVIMFGALRSRNPNFIWGWKNCGRLPS